MAPVSENRGAIIYGLGSGISPLVFLPIAILFNILAIFPLFWFLRKARIINLVHRVLGRRISNLIERNKEKLRVYEELALLFFVAVPLPGTGAWTGAILANVLKMKPRKSKFIIAIGVLIAGIVVFLSAYGVSAAVNGLIRLLRL